MIPFSSHEKLIATQSYSFLSSFFSNAFISFYAHYSVYSCKSQRIGIPTELDCVVATERRSPPSLPHRNKPALAKVNRPAMSEPRADAAVIAGGAAPGTGDSGDSGVGGR